MNTGRLLFIGLLAVATVSIPAAAQSPSCTGNSRLMSWPSEDPVWEFCFIQPQHSSGPDGSGLEIHDVYYHGIQVMKRGHVPMLNVDYDPGGCGCFRDWLHSEKDYRTDNQVAPGYYEPPFAAETVCDHATNPSVPPGDCPWGGPGPCHEGVSAEFYQDSLVLTTQANAGWYRYSMRWSFYLDGTIEPTFGFGTYNTSCASATHRHHAYWRFDFDIDGPAEDFVTEDTLSFETEESRTWGDGSVTWEVQDSQTGRGYRITPGAQDILLPVDSFSRTDFMVSLFHSNELSDTGFGCEVDVDSIVNGETVLNTDVVLYYRGGVQDVLAQNIHLCKVAGPTLTPLGEWGMEFTGFADGFESGDTSAWSETVP